MKQLDVEVSTPAHDSQTCNLQSLTGRHATRILTNDFQTLVFCSQISSCYLLQRYELFSRLNFGQLTDRQTLVYTLWLIAMEMQYAWASNNWNLVYALWQEVLKLVHAFWTLQPVIRWEF